jgi:hypothetical protein
MKARNACLRMEINDFQAWELVHIFGFQGEI